MDDDRYDPTEDLDSDDPAVIDWLAKRWGPRIDAFTEWRSQFWTEGFRAAVITGHAYADTRVLEILRERLAPPLKKSERDALLHFDGALGSANARNHACYRMRIYDAAAFYALDRFRELRNRCAHDHPPATLEDAKIEGLARAFVDRVKGCITWRFASDEVAADASLEEHVRVAVVAVLLWLELIAAFPPAPGAGAAQFMSSPTPGA